MLNTHETMQRALEHRLFARKMYMGDFREFHVVISVRRMSLFVVFEIETMLYVRIVASRFQVSLKYRC